MEIKVFRNSNDDLVFHYKKEDDPDIYSENDNYFSVIYLGQDEEGVERDVVCDYMKDHYYYEKGE